MTPDSGLSVNFREKAACFRYLPISLLRPGTARKMRGVRQDQVVARRQRDEARRRRRGRRHFALDATVRFGASACDDLLRYLQ